VPLGSGATFAYFNVLTGQLREIRRSRLEHESAWIEARHGRGDYLEWSIVSAGDFDSLERLRAAEKSSGEAPGCGDSPR
jgi:hypothetical protein